MSLLDLLLGLIIISSVMAGFVAGFARVGIGFCAAIAGVVFGFWFYKSPAAWFHKFISSHAVSNVLGFLVVFWAILIVGALIAKMVSTFFKWTGLSWLDRLLGAAFGFVRGAVIGVGFVAVLLAFAPKPLPNWMVSSVLLPYAIDGSNLFASMAPSELKDAFREGMDEVRKDWDDQLQKSRRKRGLPNAKPNDDKQVI
jgi:membrane protein required for colicin V production